MSSKKLIYADDARRAILQEDPKLAYCIERIKAVDAVEVVRCKNCKNWNNACCGLGTGDCHLLERLTFETFFCCYGERKYDGK